MKRRYTLGALAGIAALTFSVMSAQAELAKVTIVDDEKIPQSLTGKEGDPMNGRKVAVNRRKGNCLACHVISEIKDQQFHGQVGPPLDDVGSRMSAAEIRLRIVDPKVVNEDTIMPSFYRVDGFHRVMKKWQGKTIVSAQEVEDMIAYLMTLKGSYTK